MEHPARRRSGGPTRIGCGAGFAGDRLDPAVDLLARGGLDYLVLECLAERTIAAGQLRRLGDPDAGYDPLLERRLAPLLPLVATTGTRLVSNIGAANPRAAAAVVSRLAHRMGLDVAVAVVTGDDVLAGLDRQAPAWEDGVPLAEHGTLVSANAYLGADAVAAALRTGADVVITGRVADPSLFLGCLVHGRGWDLQEVDLMAHGTLVGHLLECAGQVTGGYFADPPLDVVPDLARLGFPLAEVREDGAVLAKLPHTGGRLDAETVLQQLAYEITDPHAYTTPDVVADFTGVRVTDLGGDRVHVSGATGSPRPPTLKVSVGYRAGFRCEAEISYAGQGARGRAELAGQVVHERVAGLFDHVHTQVLGVDPVLEPDGGAQPGSGWCQLRMAATAEDAATAARLGEEVTALYTNGPAGGGGVRVIATDVVGVLSSTVGRAATPVAVDLIGSPA